MRKIGIFLHPGLESARELGEQLRQFLLPKVAEVWMTSAWDDKTALEKVKGSDLLVCVGGDGTVLWAARTTVGYDVPIIGIDMGRLAFLAELGPEEATARLTDILEGAGRREERAMLRVLTPTGQEYHGLNDAVVARSTAGRPVYVDVHVEGKRLGYYHGDAIIVATATGSTAYSLSAGGPILYPEAKELIITPVAAHMASARSVVVPPTAIIELRVATDHRAVLSIDGQVDHPLSSGDTVTVGLSPHVTCFLRLGEPSDYYAVLGQRLGWTLRNSGPRWPASEAL